MWPQDLPPNAQTEIAEALKDAKASLRDMGDLLNESAIWKARTQDVGYLDLTGCMALGITGPCLRSTGLPHDLRKTEPYCGYENYEFDVITDDGCDAYGRYIIRVKEMWESVKIVEQCLDKLQPGPTMVENRKIAWPADLKVGPDGLGNSPEHIDKIMGGSMEALIHHFKLVTEGIRVPAGPGLRRRRIASRRAGCAHGQRRRHPPVPGALPGPVVHQSAGRRRDVRGRHGRRRDHRGGQYRPGDGRGGPMTAAQAPARRPVNGERVFIRLGPPREEPGQFVTDGAPQSYPADVQARLEVDAKEIIGRYPDPRSALLPLLHLVQAQDGYLTPAGLEFCGAQLGLTGAEVAAVASFYTCIAAGPPATTWSACAPTHCAR